MLKILITGGDGFIARNLSEGLNADYAVSAPNSQELNLLDPIQTSDYLKRNLFDVVIHAATYDAAPKHSTKDPAKVLENNLKMFFNLVRGKAHFGRMIYFGSGAEYSREHWIPKMKEDYFDQHVPEDQYGFSKYIMAKYAQLADHIYNLRLFAVFGKYEDWRVRLISSICQAVILGQPVKIRQNNNYDFLYVDDLVKVVKWFLASQPKNRAYNICSGEDLDFKAIAEKIVGISGKKLDILIENKDKGKEYTGDNSLLLSELKGFKFTPIDESIQALYNWYALNKREIFGGGG